MRESESDELRRRPGDGMKVVGDEREQLEIAARLKSSEEAWFCPPQIGDRILLERPMISGGLDSGDEVKPSELWIVVGYPQRLLEPTGATNQRNALLCG